MINPTTAVTPDITQKRITILGSGHPIAWRWWCIGAERKTFFFLTDIKENMVLQYIIAQDEEYFNGGEVSGEIEEEIGGEGSYNTPFGIDGNLADVLGEDDHSNY